MSAQFDPGSEIVSVSATLAGGQVGARQTGLVKVWFGGENEADEGGGGGAVNSQTCAVASQSYLLPVKYILCTLTEYQKHRQFSVRPGLISIAVPIMTRRRYRNPTTYFPGGSWGTLT
eukprot:COSAG01_NODE_782_length_13631_cov_73.763450_19_plen_118_part_00